MKSELNVTVTPPSAFNSSVTHPSSGFLQGVRKQKANHNCDITNELCTVLQCYCKVGAVEKRNRAG